MKEKTIRLIAFILIMLCVPLLLINTVYLTIWIDSFFSGTAIFSEEIVVISLVAFMIYACWNSYAKNGAWKWCIISVCGLDIIAHITTLRLWNFALLLDVLLIVLSILCAKKVKSQSITEDLECEKTKEDEK